MKQRKRAIKKEIIEDIDESFITPKLTSEQWEETVRAIQEYRAKRDPETIRKEEMLADYWKKKMNRI